MFQAASRAAAFDDAVLAREYRRGHFNAVASAIDEALERGEAVSGGVFLLRARVMVKTDAPATIEFLTRGFGALDATEQAEATMLLGVAHGRASDDRAAELALTRAGKMIQLLASDELAEEHRYHLGFLRWTQGRLDEARDAAVDLRSAGSIDVRIRAKILESLIFATTGKHREEAGASLEAFDLTQQNDNVELAAYAARNLSTLARELPMPQIREKVRRAVTAIPWTEELRDLQFKTLKAAAWCSALDGDFLNAFRLLKAATKAAPTDHWRVMAALDRSYLAKCLAEPRWAEQELLDAHELAGQLDWRAVTHEEHVALALMAELYSEVDAAVSLSYLARFREIARSLDRNLSFAHDRRVGAIADYSAGIVYARLGDTDAAREAFSAAWDVFDSLHYDWRAGRCARELYALTGRRVWLERARRKLEGYRSSWLCKGLFDAEDGDGPLERLTPAQRRIFALLVAGTSTDGIVESVGRSVFTVRNHIKAVLAAFEVNSRAALVAEAARLGLAG